MSGRNSKPLHPIGSHRSQKVLNALILLNCDEGEFQNARSKNEVVSSVLQVSMRKYEKD